MFVRQANMLALLLGITCVLAADPSIDLAVRTRNAPGLTTRDTHFAIRRAVEIARLQTRESLSGNVTLDKSWDGAVLLKFNPTPQTTTSKQRNDSLTFDQTVEIVCTKCYVKGLAKAALSIPKDFNASAAVDATALAIGDRVKNITESVEDYFADYFIGAARNLEDGFDVADFAFPRLNYSFDIPVPKVPEVTLDFQFDGLEMYLQLNTILGASTTYELNMYTSNTPIGIGIGKDLMLGVVFKVDLVLNAAGSININNGVHLKLEDGLALQIALFGDKVSKIGFNGGKFEMLPVTIESAGVVIKAALRIGIHSGMVLSTPQTPQFTAFNETYGIPQVSGGIEVGLDATVAEFVTNVTYSPNDQKCKVRVVQEYQMALGAAVGATVALKDATWGPVAATTIPIWTTTIADKCATLTTSSPTSITSSASAKIRKRDDLSTTTTVTKITHTGVQCASVVAGACPPSLQMTSQSTETRTLTSAVKSGVKVTWPATPGVNVAVATTVPFGSGVITLTPTSGAPASYTAPPISSSTDHASHSSPNDASSVLGGKVRGVSTKLIVGLSVGLGVPVLLAMVGASFFWLIRKRQYNTVKSSQQYEGAGTTPMDTQAYVRESSSKFEPYREVDKASKPSVNVTEVSS